MRPNAGAPIGSPPQKASAALAKARAGLLVKVCGACGGEDGLCDGAGDLSPGRLASLRPAPPSRSRTAVLAAGRWVPSATSQRASAASRSSRSPAPIACRYRATRRIQRDATVEPTLSWQSSAASPATPLAGGAVDRLDGPRAGGDLQVVGPSTTTVAAAALRGRMGTVRSWREAVLLPTCGARRSCCFSISSITQQECCVR